MVKERNGKSWKTEYQILKRVTDDKIKKLSDEIETLKSNSNSSENAIVEESKAVESQPEIKEVEVVSEKEEPKTLQSPIEKEEVKDSGENLSETPEETSLVVADVQEEEKEKAEEFEYQCPECLTYFNELNENSCPQCGEVLE